MACLFLCASGIIIKTSAQEWAFDPATQKAYDQVLALRLDEAHALIPEPQTPQDHYVTALAEAVELLITEDGARYTEYEDRFEKRLERRTGLNTPDDLFLLAEIRMQWAFIYFKFGHEFDAALNLRQAYLTTAEIKRRFPAFQAIKKTSALLEVIFGSVPEKYEWILSLLNIRGSIETGLEELQSIRTSGHPLSLEADVLYALIQGFVLQHEDIGVSVMDKILAQYPENRLALFTGASLAIKNSQSEKALALLTRISQAQQGLPLYYAEYLKGEVYLHKAEYLNAITAYGLFINHYKGQNFIKDGNYKIGLSYWLNGNVNDAYSAFELARNLGKETAEADKYAARSLAESELPHIKLTKARYYTDGGYYEEARKIFSSIRPDEIPTARDQVEFYYRMARLDHKVGNLDSAKHAYKKVIEMNDHTTWYFAPNACLQMGYILVLEHNTKLAESYFEQALSYKKHEYKNSIDAKAKSALAQLRRR